MDKNINHNEDQHIVHMWEPFNFKPKRGYDYRKIGFFNTLFYFFSRGIVQGLLNIYNHFVFGMKVQGKKNIKKISKKQGSVVIANHVHILDCTLIASLVGRMRRIYFTTLESNFNIPVIRHLVKGLGGVPIPENISGLNEFFHEMQNALIDGDFVCMYPESVLYPYYEGIRDFKSGAFHLAVDTNSPIIPMVITFRKPTGFYALYKKKPCLTITALEPIEIPKNGEHHEKIIELMNKCHFVMTEAVDNQKFIPPSRRYCFGLRIRNRSKRGDKNKG
ncbi:MAG: lysophospholipid acyltransferase family protein [Sphaerochaetaceae bacterium]|nr:lysophospholipid acyltransferase family protein [Sphaerochaetaceae bacterium]